MRTKIGAVAPLLLAVLFGFTLMAWAQDTPSQGAGKFRGGPVTSAITFPDGSAGAPAFSFTSDTDLGLYRIGADQLGVSGHVQTGASSLIRLGGATSSFPALKRSSTALQVRLADDSAFAPLFTAGITPAGAITFPTGLGGIAHVVGPSDGTFLIQANSANPGQFWSDGWDYVTNNGGQTLLRLTSAGSLRMLRGQVLQWANSTTNMGTAGSGISIPSDTVFAFGNGTDANASGTILATNTTLTGALSCATYQTTVKATSTGTTTIDATATVWPCDTSGGDFTITLPTASGISGRVYVIKQVGASGTLTIDGNGAETIDGAANKTLAVQYASYTLVSNGSNWLIQ